MNPSEIVHSIIVRMNSYDNESNQQESLVLNSPNGEYLNADSNLKGAMRILIEQESEDELRNNNNQNEEDILDILIKKIYNKCISFNPNERPSSDNILDYFIILIFFMQEISFLNE